MTLLFQHLAKASNGDTEIVGTGIRVYTILGLYEFGDTAEVISDAYDLPIAAVYEALAYAFEHPEEMETIRRADEAAERQMLSQLPQGLRRRAKRAMQASEQVRQEAILKAKEARRGAPVP